MTPVRIFYAVAAVVGVVVTGMHNLRFVEQYGGFSIEAFITDNYVNAASASITNDILVVAAVFLVWSFVEARRLRMKHWWLYAIATVGIAIAFSFPLFMLMRDRALHRAAATG